MGSFFVVCIYTLYFFSFCKVVLCGLKIQKCKNFPWKDKKKNFMVNKLTHTLDIYEYDLGDNAKELLLLVIEIT